MTRVLIVEPYLTGSHRAWVEGYRAHSALEVDLLVLPGRFWKWRMHGAAVTLARRVRESGRRPHVVVATDMLDLAAFLGLARGELGDVPAAVYFHENQLAYPSPDPDPAWTPSRRRRASRPGDAHYPFANLTSALAADLVLWNSAYNRDSFLARLPAFLRAFPDEREFGAIDIVARRSEILPLGLDMAGLGVPPEDAGAWPAGRRPGPPRIVWNHRWEHDKGPERFFGALADLAAEGLVFEVIVLGESFVRTPPVFAAAERALGPRIIQFGHAPSRSEYARWLHDGDIVVSTARHEFFGAAVCEAIACGCRPVLPDALSYPSLIPPALHDAVLFHDDEALRDRLRAAIRTVAAIVGSVGDAPSASSATIRTYGQQQAVLRAAVMAFDWSVMAPRYDARLVALAGTG